MNKKNHYNPKVFFSIHGILSLGKWQLIAEKKLIELNYKSIKYSYGFIVFPWFIKLRIRKFKNWYFNEINKIDNNLKIEEPFHRPSIISHSYGTYIIVKAMEKYPEIKFDKIYLYGSIIPFNFDWYSLYLNDQFNVVILEKTKKDIAIKFSFLITGSFYPSAKFGFKQNASFIKYEKIDKSGHSDFQYEQRFNNHISKHQKGIPNQLLLVNGSEIEKKQLRKYFKETEKIDLYNYGISYQENQITIEHALEWADIEKNIWSFLVNSYSRKIVGYINLISLDDATYNSFINGNISEDEIKANEITSFDINKKLNLVIMSIALDKLYQMNVGLGLTSKIGEFIIMSLSDKIIRITDSGKKLNSISAVGWTPVGKNLCQSFGFETNGQNYLEYPIYILEKEQIIKGKNSSRPFCHWWINEISKNISKN